MREFSTVKDILINNILCTTRRYENLFGYKSLLPLRLLEYFLTSLLDVISRLRNEVIIFFLNIHIFLETFGHYSYKHYFLYLLFIILQIFSSFMLL